MTKYKCPNCDQLLNDDDIYEQDDGGWEEFWGAKVWCPYITLYSKCCSEEVEDHDEQDEEKEADADD